MIEFAEATIGIMGVLARATPRDTTLPCRVDVLDANGVRALAPGAWDRLLTDGLEENPWLSRQMVLADMDAYGAKSRALALYHTSSDALIGLVPYRVTGIGPVGVASTQLNLYQVSGVPLISKSHAQLAVSGLLRAFQCLPGLPRFWRLPHIVAGGPFMTMAETTAQKLGMAAGLAARYRRPVLTRAAGDFAGHVRTVIGKKRAKDIERNIRRLAETGKVRFERALAPEAVMARVEDFLALEAAGWKGKKGTALLSNARDAAFARAGFGGNIGDSGPVRVDSLLLDEVPIAVSVNLAGGKTLYTPKCAFDERYRAFGPGMILEYKVIEHFFGETEFAQMDAATTVDGHVINRLWDQNIEMGTLLIGPDRVVVRGLTHAIEGLAAFKAGLKSLLGRG